MWTQSYKCKNWILLKPEWAGALIYPCILQKGVKFWQDFYFSLLNFWAETSWAHLTSNLQNLQDNEFVLFYDAKFLDYKDNIYVHNNSAILNQIY